MLPVPGAISLPQCSEEDRTAKWPETLPSKMAAFRPAQQRRLHKASLPGPLAKNPSLPSQGEMASPDLGFDPADLNVSLLQLPEQDDSSPVSTQSIVVNMGLTVQHDSSEPEPTLRDILLAVTT